MTRAPVLPSDERRCKAKCNATGERCRGWAISGGTVCNKHGGSAPQVRAKAKERVARAELLAEAKADPTLADATPAEMLLHAAHSTGRVVLMLQKQGAGHSLDPANLDLLGEWLDRLSKAASVVVSSKADELVIAQQARIAEGQARQIAEVMNRVLNALGLTPEQAARVPDALGSALASLGLIPKPSASARPANSSDRNLAMLTATGGRDA